MSALSYPQIGACLRIDEAEGIQIWRIRTVKSRTLPHTLTVIFANARSLQIVIGEKNRSLCDSFPSAVAVDSTSAEKAYGNPKRHML